MYKIVLFFYHQGGPTLDQRFESYYNYCNLFNYILSKWDDYTLCAPLPQYSECTFPELVFEFRCWWTCSSGAAQPVAVGHHWWVHLPGRVLCSAYFFFYRQPLRFWQMFFLYSSSPLVSTAVKQPKKPRRRLSSWETTQRYGTSTASWMFSILL